jgi:hypothetical protein
MFKRNHLIISGDIPASDYSDISSLGRRSGGAKPRERHGIRLQAEIDTIHTATPPRIAPRPRIRNLFCQFSGETICIVQERIRLPIIRIYLHWGRRSGGAKPRERRPLLLFYTWSKFNNKINAAKKSAPSADQELVLSMFQRNHLNITGEIPIIRIYLHWGAAAAGRSPGSVDSQASLAFREQNIPGKKRKSPGRKTGCRSRYELNRPGDILLF